MARLRPYSLRCTALARSNHLEEARAVYRRLVERAASEYVSSALLAVAAAGAGEREQALALARRAWEDRDPFFLVVARYNPVYRWFREQPEFAAILQELDAPVRKSP